MSLHSPAAIKPLPAYRLWIRFDDGVEGVADLSKLAGKGEFQRWTERPSSFENATIANDGSLLWDGELDLCSDALYLEISQKPIDEVFPLLRDEALHA